MVTMENKQCLTVQPISELVGIVNSIVTIFHNSNRFFFITKCEESILSLLCYFTLKNKMNYLFIKKQDSLGEIQNGKNRE